MAYKKPPTTLYIFYKRLQIKPYKKIYRNKIYSKPRTPTRIVGIIVNHKHRITEDINDNILQHLFTLYFQLALKHIPS